MKKGDPVRYSKQHYLWLLDAGRWPNRKMPKTWNKPGRQEPVLRREIVGEVMDVEMVKFETVVKVHWNKEIYKDHGSVTSHLIDNLEAIVV